LGLTVSLARAGNSPPRPCHRLRRTQNLSAVRPYPARNRRGGRGPFARQPLYTHQSPAGGKGEKKGDLYAEKQPAGADRFLASDEKKERKELAARIMRVGRNRVLFFTLTGGKKEKKTHKQGGTTADMCTPGILSGRGKGGGRTSSYQKKGKNLFHLKERKRTILMAQAASEGEKEKGELASREEERRRSTKKKELCMRGALCSLSSGEAKKGSLFSQTPRSVLPFPSAHGKERKEPLQLSCPQKGCGYFPN